MCGTASTPTSTIAATAAAIQLHLRPARKSMAARNEMKLNVLPVSWPQKDQECRHNPDRTSRGDRPEAEWALAPSAKILRQYKNRKDLGKLRGLNTPQRAQLQPVLIPVYCSAQRG